jgi:hypothetical protein
VVSWRFEALTSPERKRFLATLCNTRLWADAYSDEIGIRTGQLLTSKVDGFHMQADSLSLRRMTSLVFGSLVAIAK